MASKNEKICHLLLFLVMIVHFRIVITTNIDCGGKPFHCVNSTHFMICVDLGSGVTKTVNDFMIQCPLTTVCSESNNLECEYQAPTTTESILGLGEEIETNAQTSTTTVPPFQKTSVTELYEYVNTISHTPQPDVVADMHIQQLSTIAEIRGISTNINDIAPTGDHINLTTTETYAGENLITTSTQTTSVDKSEQFELFKISKNKLFQKVTILPFYSKSEKSIDTNTKTNITNETSILYNLATNGEKALRKNETSYVKTADDNKTTRQMNSDSSILNSQDIPYTYSSDLNIPSITTLSDLILTTTDHLNKNDIIFKDTTSEVIQDLSSNGTTKLLSQDLPTLNAVLSENVTVTLKVNQTSTSPVTLIEERTEKLLDKILFSANATESSMLSMHDSDIPKYTTSNGISTTHLNTINPTFSNSFSIANGNTTETPITTLPLFTTFQIRFKFIGDTTGSKENTETTTVSYNTMKDNDFNLSQQEVQSNTPLQNGVTSTIPNAITMAQEDKNITLATSGASSSITTHLLQDQITTEASISKDFIFSNTIGTDSKSPNNNVTQAPGVVISLPKNYETTKEVITEFTKEPEPSFKVIKSSDDTGRNISTNTDKSFFNKPTKGLFLIAPEFSTVEIATAVNNFESNNMKSGKDNLVDISNTMLFLEDQLEHTSSTQSPIISKFNISVFEPYSNTESPGVEITTEKPHFSSNTDIDDTSSAKYPTTLKMSLTTEAYELLPQEINVSKGNKIILSNENYVVEPIQTTIMPKIAQITITQVTAEIITDTALGTDNKTNVDIKLVSQDRMAKESLISTTKTYTTNGNITTNSFVSDNIVLESAKPTLVTNGIQINKINTEKINVSTNTMKIDEMIPIHDEISREGIMVKELYSSSTEIPNKHLSLLADNNFENVTNILTVVTDTLTTGTTSSVIDKETYLKHNITSVKIDNNSENYITEKTHIINNNMIRNNSILPINDTAADSTVKNISIQEQQTFVPSYVENSLYNIKTANIANSDGRKLLVNTQISSDKDTHKGTVSPVTERFESQPIIANIYINNDKPDMIEISNVNNLITSPDFNPVIDIFPKVQMPNSVILLKKDIDFNKHTTESFKANSEGLKHEEKADDKQITQVLIQKMEATLNNTNVNEEKPNIINANEIIHNHTVNTQIESIKPISMGKINVPDNNIITVTNPQVATEITGDIFQNKNNDLIIKADTVIGDTVDIKVTKETVVDNILPSLTTSLIDIISSTSGTFVPINLPIANKNAGKIPENMEDKANTILTNTMNTQLAQEAMAHSVMGSVTPRTIEQIKVPNSNIDTTINSQLTTESTVNIFLNNTKTKLDMITHDIMNSQRVEETVRNSTWSSLSPTTTDEINVPNSNIVTTINSQLTSESTVNIFQNNTKIKENMITHDIINAQLVEETVHNSNLSTLSPTPTDEIKILTSNTFTTVDPIDTTKSIVKIFRNNNGIINKLDMAMSDNENVTVTKETTADFTLINVVSASNIFSTIHPQVATESTGNIFENNNNIKDYVNIFNNEAVNTELGKETLVNPVLGSLTSSSTDQNQVIQVATSNTVQVATESSEKMFNNNNNSKNKVDKIISDIVNTNLAKETIAFSVSRSSTSASTDEIKDSAINTLTTVDPLGLTQSTGKVRQNNNDVINKLDMKISDTVNVTATKEMIADSTLGSLSPLINANNVQIEVPTSNIVTTINPQIPTESNMFNNNNNNTKNKVDKIMSDTVNTNVVKEIVTYYNLGPSTPASTDEFKVSASNTFTTTSASSTFTTINPQNETGRTKNFKTINNDNNFKNKVVMLINNTANTQPAKKTIAHSVLDLLTPKPTNEAKIWHSNIFATINPQNGTESTQTKFENYSNNSFKNEMEISDTVNTQTKETVDHSVLGLLKQTSTDKIQIFARSPLTKINSHIDTGHTEKMIENKNNFEYVQKVDTIAHKLSESNPTPIRGAANNSTNDLNVLQNESVTALVNNRTSELSSGNIGIKVAISVMPKNISNHEFNKLSYENSTKKESLSTLPLLLPEKNKLHNPLSFKTNETLEKRDENIFVVPSKPIRSTTKRQLLNQTRLPQIDVDRRQLQNKPQNIAVVVSNGYKRTANKDLFTCQNRFRGRFADGNDCRKFYICIGRTQPLLGECPVNTVFSAITKQCTNNLSHCIRHNQFRCIQNGRFADALKSNVYYICVKNKNIYVRFQFQCQSGYHLDKKSVKCVIDIKSQQISSTSVDNDSNKESGQSVAKDKSKEKKRTANGDKHICKKEGKFPDLHDCRKYYVCSKNSKSVLRRRTKKCDSDEVFHPEKQKCVDSDSYECD